MGTSERRRHSQGRVGTSEGKLSPSISCKSRKITENNKVRNVERHSVHDFGTAKGLFRKFQPTPAYARRDSGYRTVKKLTGTPNFACHLAAVYHRTWPLVGPSLPRYSVFITANGPDA